LQDGIFLPALGAFLYLCDSLLIITSLNIYVLVLNRKFSVVLGDTAKTKPQRRRGTENKKKKGDHAP
ncbi:hypothetical protein, partial [Methanothrix soehngenii]|uniref:hypothetical protein n=1 Tax=Methanothrix soehngenii TaxID=2223 RepID=UPI002CB7BDA4